MLLEIRVLAGDDRLAQRGRDVVVADDDAPFDGELADDPAVAREHTGNGVRLIAVERADLRKVVGVREEHAAEGAQQSGDHKKDHEHRLSCQRGRRPEALSCGPYIIAVNAMLPLSFRAAHCGRH